MPRREKHANTQKKYTFFSGSLNWDTVLLKGQRKRGPMLLTTSGHIVSSIYLYSAYHRNIPIADVMSLNAKNGNIWKGSTEIAKVM